MKRSIFILIILAAAALRFYDFERLMIFDPERAMSLITSAELLKKPSLLGPPYFRATSYGHQLFNSPLFNYALAPLLPIFAYHPLPITAVFTVLNLLTGALIYLLFRKLIKPEIALLGSILFLFNSQMIFHSRFIWIIHPFPLFGLITLYILLKERKRPSLSLAGLLGLISGIGVGMDYTFLFWGVPLFLGLMFFSKYKLSTLLTFFGGAVIGDSPHVLFDLRHQFYNLTTLWQYTLETFGNPEQSKILYYHFFPFWPAAALLGGLLIYRVSKQNKLMAGLILAGYVFLNLTAPLTFSTYEITLKKQMEAAAAIAAERPSNFNVVSLLDFDTRGHVLRYLLEYQFKIKPERVDNYNDIGTIYALARTDYDLNAPFNYELSSFYPYRIQELVTLDETHKVYKLYR